MESFRRFRRGTGEKAAPVSPLISVVTVLPALPVSEAHGPAFSFSAETLHVKRSPESLILD